MSQAHVMTVAERRWRWSEERKRAIVAAAFALGALVSEVARRADLCASVIYRWRRESAVAASGYTDVVAAPVTDIKLGAMHGAELVGN